MVSRLVSMMLHKQRSKVIGSNFVSTSFSISDSSRIFSNKSSLSLHKSRKHEPVVKDLKCTYCDYRTCLKWILNRHIGRIHEGHRIKCPHCHYKGYEKRNVQNHIKMYHMHQQTEMYTGASEYLRSVLKLDLDLKPFNMQKGKELRLI